MSQIGTLPVSARRAIWTNFCRTGDPSFLQELPHDVAASWKRCYERGVDPGTRSLPHDVEEHPLHDTETQRLLRIALPILDSLQVGLSTAPVVWGLTDKSGRIIHRQGNQQVLHTLDEVNGVLGACITEDIAGANGAGTALFLQEPTQFDLYEHFCEGFSELATTGVPLVHPVSRQVLAALSLAVHKKPLTPELALLIRVTANSIQSRLCEDEKILHHLLLEKFIQKAQGQGSAVLAVDRNGIILATTPSFAQWLNMTPEKLHGQPLSSLSQLSQATQEAIRRDEPRETVLSLSHIDRLSKVTIEPCRKDDEAAGALLFLSAPQAAFRSVPRRGKEVGLWAARYTFAHLLGEDPQLQATLRLAKKVASTDLPVFIQGETGTGKELLAHAIHNASPRRRGPFVAINCGVIPQDLIASELFGYEKGAFTGAANSGKQGKIELADGGTLFLDEITETSPALQVSLLRALQDHEIVPVGGERAIHLDIRVIAATNQNVKRLVQQGAFRRDLYYRLHGVSLSLPPLRERPHDIVLLAHHFLAQEREEKTLSAEALNMLQQYTWPGNIRELQAVLQSAALMAEGSIIQTSDLPAEVRTATGRAVPDPAENSRALTLKEIELQALLDALRSTHGNIKHAAEALGIARSSLYRKLNEFGLAHLWTQRGERR